MKQCGMKIYETVWNEDFCLIQRILRISKLRGQYCKLKIAKLNLFFFWGEGGLKNAYAKSLIPLLELEEGLPVRQFFIVNRNIERKEEAK